MRNLSLGRCTNRAVSTATGRKSCPQELFDRLDGRKCAGNAIQISSARSEARMAAGGSSATLGNERDARIAKEKSPRRKTERRSSRRVLVRELWAVEFDDGFECLRLFLLNRYRYYENEGKVQRIRSQGNEVWAQPVAGLVDEDRRASVIFRKRSHETYGECQSEFFAIRREKNGLLHRYERV